MEVLPLVVERKTSALSHLSVSRRYIFYLCVCMCMYLYVFCIVIDYLIVIFGV